MTTLKSFQAEIEQISHEKQKAAIQAAKDAHAAAELAKHHGKTTKKEITEEAEVDDSDTSLEVSRDLTNKANV